MEGAWEEVVVGARLFEGLLRCYIRQVWDEHVKDGTTPLSSIFKRNITRELD